MNKSLPVVWVACVTNEVKYIILLLERMTWNILAPRSHLPVSQLFPLLFPIHGQGRSEQRYAILPFFFIHDQLAMGGTNTRRSWASTTQLFNDLKLENILRRV